MDNLKRVDSKSILVVDDNGISRLLPGLILRPFGWDVYEVDCGSAAVAALQKIQIDCVLLDLSMPSVSGFDVLKELRSDSDFKYLRIVAYTGYATSEDTLKLISLGFDAVLIKPLTSIKLLELLKNS